MLDKNNRKPNGFGRLVDTYYKRYFYDGQFKNIGFYGYMKYITVYGNCTHFEIENRGKSKIYWE